MPLSSDLLNVIENFNAQQNHFFCEKLTQIIYSRHVKNGDCVIDCGANQGLHTRELSRLVGETGIVHAFEPNPDLIKILLNINSNVRVWPFAAGETLDIVRLHVPTGLEGWASLHDIRPILQNYQFKLFSTIQVDLNRLDEIHERPVRFVKLDVERHELAALKGAGIWLSLSMTALFAASMFTLFTYVAPLLGDVTGVSPKGVTWTLLLIGLGLTVGNIIGGKLADKRLAATLIGVFISMAVVSTLLSWTSVAVIPTEITLFLWATASFAAVPALQINVVTFGKAAPNLVSTLNIGAFNIGNALGAWVGGSVIAHGFGLTSVPLAAAALAILALLVTLITFRQGGNADLAPATH